MYLKTIKYSLICIASLSLYVVSASAGSLSATVSENGQGRLPNAVVYAVPTAGLSNTEKSIGNSIIDQIDKEFVPRVSVFQAGVNVQFPNHDKVRHHV